MNKDLVNSIVKCAFRICSIYFMKFFVPNVNLGSYKTLPQDSNYEAELNKAISKMRDLLLKDYQNNSNNITSVEETDEYARKTAYKQIKKNLTIQLKEKYGDNIQIDFCNEKINKNNDNDKDVIILKTENESVNEFKEGHDRKYALKIKEIGQHEPNTKNFDENDIYVNTKTKTYHIKVKNGFNTYPLGKRSIVRYG